LNQLKKSGHTERIPGAEIERIPEFSPIPFEVCDLLETTLSFPQELRNIKENKKPHECLAIKESLLASSEESEKNMRYLPVLIKSQETINQKKQKFMGDARNFTIILKTD